MEDVHPEFTFNCREELDGHVNCVKLFLEQHVKHGVPYIPGSGDDRDQCAMTRSLYMTGPKPCEMELSMHGTCVANQLERTQKMGEKYWTQGGEDLCCASRKNYERCMKGTLEGLTDKWGGSRLSEQLEKNIAHLQVRLDNK